MSAPPLAFSTGANARAMRSGPKKFTSNCSRAASIAPSAREAPGVAMPALSISSVTSAALRAASAMSAFCVTSSFSGTTPGSVTALGSRAPA
jgi:hypothetical protein